jgi:Tfp pilus assembly protein PilX
MVLCLVILFAMTLIGVSSMDSAVLELKMSNTMQQQVVALNRAEATLQTAEDEIDVIVSDGTVYNFETENDGFYSRDSGVVVEQADWSAVTAEAGPVSTDNGVDDDDLFVVQYLGEKAIPGETVKVNTDGGIAGGSVHTFRNTTRSASGRSVVRIVQSIYVTLDSP